MIKLIKIVVLLIVAMGLGTMVSSAQELTANETTKTLSKGMAIDYDGVVMSSESFEDGTLLVFTKFVDADSFKDIKVIIYDFFSGFSDLTQTEPWQYNAKDDFYFCMYYSSELEYHIIVIFSEELKNTVGIFTMKGEKQS